jgi:NitT/TauT family transport system ATP-binding protein
LEADLTGREKPKSGAASERSIRLSRVDKVFAGRNSVRALAPIDLEICRGQFVSLLGPSGCGKSTLLNIIAGFETPSSGQISFFGRDRAARPGPDRAVVFQEPTLFPWLTVWDNVVYGPRAQGKPKASYADAARRYIDLVGLRGFERHLPEQLSGGMKQRVGLARCLIMEPEALLMDEPFGALDAQTRLQMQELLLGVWERLRTTVLFITHDIDEAILLADIVYVMSARPGRLKSRFDVDLPRPRHAELLTDLGFNRLRSAIMAEIRAETSAAGEPR